MNKKWRNVSNKLPNIQFTIEWIWNKQKDKTTNAIMNQPSQINLLLRKNEIGCLLSLFIFPTQHKKKKINKISSLTLYVSLPFVYVCTSRYITYIHRQYSPTLNGKTFDDIRLHTSSGVLSKSYYLFHKRMKLFSIV